MPLTGLLDAPGGPCSRVLVALLVGVHVGGVLTYAENLLTYRLLENTIGYV